MQARLATTMGAIATLAASTQAQPATSNWALSGADQQRTGRSQFAGSTDGLLQWRLGILGNGEPHTAGVVLGSGGEIYVGTMSRPSNQGMYAVSADGTVLWNNPTPSRIQRAGAVLQDGSIIALSRDHSIYNFAANGSINWAVDPDVGPIRDFFSSPNVGNDGTIYATRQNSGLYAFNPDGSVKWNVDSGVSSGVSPAIDHGGNIIWGGDDGILRAVNSLGIQQWSRDLGTPLITSSPSVSHDGTVFIGTVDNGLFALDGSGNLLWHRSDINGALGSVAVRADGSLVVAGAGNTLWSLGADGSTHWMFDGEGTAAEILSSPIVDADGRVFASMDTDTMFCFDLDGSILFEYQTGGSILAPGALSDLGTLYFGSTDGFLYAVGTPIPAPSALFVIPSALVFTSRRRR
ncbi:MAG: hypothetical protein Kow0022_03900 [Phycisphaerales bacterium]